MSNTGLIGSMQSNQSFHLFVREKAFIRWPASCAFVCLSMNRENNFLVYREIVLYFY